MTKKEIIKIATNTDAMAKMLKIQEICNRRRFTLNEIYWDDEFVNGLASEIQKLCKEE